MGKKLVIFLTIICIGLAAVVVWFRLEKDKIGPEIQCVNSEFVYHEGVTNQELLDNVKAIDEKDGDVSISLAIESVYAVSDTEVAVVYVAKDKSNNITKLKQSYASDGSLQAVDIHEEGDDVSKEPQPETTEQQSQAEVPQTEERPISEEIPAGEGVVSAAPEAEEARQAQEAAAEAMPAECPRIYLTDYIVRIPVGTAVDRLSYVKEITDDADNVYDLWTRIQISGALDVQTPGTYECTYFVVDSQNNTSNQAVLKFIVE